MDDPMTIRLNISHYRALLRTNVADIGRRALLRLLTQARADLVQSSLGKAVEKARSSRSLLGAARPNADDLGVAHPTMSRISVRRHYERNSTAQFLGTQDERPTRHSRRGTRFHHLP